MSTPEPAPNIPNSSTSHQNVEGDRNQTIGQMFGGMAVGQLTVYLSQIPTKTETNTANAPVELGQNPYQGLKVFRETDGDRFFGRGLQAQELCQRLQQLHNGPKAIRVLPIYGPSGSGKSSLARAGLIPTLGKQSFPGHDRGRVVVMTPSNHPIEALATVLARIATNDPIPVTKVREFQEELVRLNHQNEWDGLRRIASIFPDINFSPLIILVDQFEEVYTLCQQEQERQIFVENLLCAAGDRSRYVSVIVTMRSDFLGATQQHPRLNQLFSSQGFLVPIMQAEELEIAITEPAKRAGYELDRAIVRWLLKESEGQEGALPLLQFALTQIWEGLRNGIKPADTLEKIGGVGGALANEAKRLYESLPSKQQNVARSIFLALIQLNDDNKSTRRRVAIAELITNEYDASLVREVINQFAQPGVWILITFANEKQVEMVEVAHEALIRNWKELQEWLKEHWQALCQKRKLEQAATEWEAHQKSQDFLLQGRSLRAAKEFIQTHKNNSETAFSNLAAEFLKASIKTQKINTLKLASMFLVFPLVGTLIAVHFLIIGRANSILSRNDCKPHPEIKGLLEYMWWTGYANRLRDISLCNQDIQEIKLPNATMPYTNFDLANLAGSDFRGANLSLSSFRGATLAYANFNEKTVLMSADFGCKGAECTTLFGANLEDSDLSSANLKGANLKQVNLKGTNLQGSNLTGVRGLTKQQLEEALLCKTVLPDYLNSVSGNRDCHLLGMQSPSLFITPFFPFGSGQLSPSRSGLLISFVELIN